MRAGRISVQYMLLKKAIRLHKRHVSRAVALSLEIIEENGN